MRENNIYFGCMSSFNKTTLTWCWTSLDLTHISFLHFSILRTPLASLCLPLWFASFSSTRTLVSHSFELPDVMSFSLIPEPTGVQSEVLYVGLPGSLTSICRTEHIHPLTPPREKPVLFLTHYHNSSSPIYAIFSF